MTAAIALGAAVGLAVGILISLTTDVPLAPEARLVLGAVLGWLLRRNRALGTQPGPVASEIYVALTSGG